MQNTKMQTTNANETKLSPKLTLRRQTHMHCIVCQCIPQYYNEESCNNCGSCKKWSVPWKNIEKLVD